MRVYDSPKWKKRTKFGNDVFSHLTKRLPVKSMKKSADRNLPNYLFERDGKANCTACGRVFDIAKLDRHNSTRRCPKCRKEVVVVRKNGKFSYYDTCNIIYPEIVDDMVVIRYFYRARQIYNNVPFEVGTDVITEVGRRIIGKDIDYRYEQSTDYGRENDNKWYAISDTENAGYWFCVRRNPMAWYSENKECILTHCVYYPQFKAVVDATVGKEFCEAISIYRFMRWGCALYADYKGVNSFDDVFYFRHKNISDLNSYTLTYEKFDKVGLTDLLSYGYRGYYNEYRSEVSKNPNISIITLLGIDKDAFRYILNSDARGSDRYKLLCLFRKNKNLVHPLPLDMVDTLRKTFGTHLSDNDLRYFQTKTQKKLNYITSHKISVSEYIHYLQTLEENNFPMDNSSLFPKDFRTADLKLSEDIQRLEVERKALNKTNCTNVLNTIRDGLAKMPELKKYMNGSKGLVVKVPETAEELIREGSRLHNCLSTYVDKVRRNKCIIFFVRRIEEPDTAYYAMEYSDGIIRQLRTTNNKLGDHYNEVYTFCKGFITALEKATEINRRKALVA